LVVFPALSGGGLAWLVGDIAGAGGTETVVQYMAQNTALLVIVAGLARLMDLQPASFREKLSDDRKAN
jgi:hypothetical protein